MLEKYSFPEVNVRLNIKEASVYYSETPINTPDDAVVVMSDILSELDRENLVVVNLDAKSKPINYTIVSIGGLTESVVSVQNVFKVAILSNAANIMLFHNHPSGDVKPSFEDLLATEKIVKAGKLLGVKVLDHIIVGSCNKKHYSIRMEEEKLFE